MMEEELRLIWQSSANEERVKFEKSRLIIDVQLSLDRIHKAIKFRDRIETIAAVIVIPIFLYNAYIFPPILSKIASILIAFWAVFVIIQLRRARKHQPGVYTETYLEYLLKTRDYLLVQKRLLDTVLYWYILPCSALVFLLLLGFIGPENFTKITIKLAVCAVLGIIIYFLNKRAVKKYILPRLNKVEELIKVMEE